MLHAAIGELGNQHQVVLGKWKRLREVVGKIVLAEARQPQDLVRFLLRPLQTRASHEQARSGGVVVQLRERPGRKRENVSADRLGTREAAKGSRAGGRRPTERAPR